MIDERVLIEELERIVFEADIHKSYVQEVFKDMIEAVKQQPKATPIIRSVDEIADIMAHNMNCANCTILKQCDQKIRTCETKGIQACVDWLTGKQGSTMNKKSKEIMARYVAACDRYTQEKADNVVNPRVGTLNTFNQCTVLRGELLKAILEENGYGERKI